MEGTVTYLPFHCLSLVMALFHYVRTALMAFHTSWPDQYPDNTSIILQLFLQSASNTTLPKHEKAQSRWISVPTWLIGTYASPSPSLSYDSSRNSSMSSLMSEASATTYLIAHPPPLTSPVLQSAKLLLQLQERRPTARPRPAFEVVPAASLVPKLLRRSSRIVRDKTGYGSEDLLILHAEDYEKSIEGQQKDLGEEEYGSRAHFGAICHNFAAQSTGGKRVKETEIHLGDGTTWKAQHISGTCYEFTLQGNGEERITVRWTSRITSISSRRRSSTSTRKRFIFTTMDPNASRHPALGTLQDELTIFDAYKVPHSEPAEIVTISEQIRSFMLISAIWVIFMEQWSPYLRCDENGTSLLSIRSGSANSLLSARAPPTESSASLRSPAGKQNRPGLSMRSKHSPRAQPDVLRRASSPLPSPVAHQAHKRSMSDSSYFVQPQIEDDVFEDTQSTTTVRHSRQQPTSVEEENMAEESDAETVVQTQTRNIKEAEVATRERITEEHTIYRQKQKRRGLRLLARMSFLKRLFRNPWRK